MDVDLIFKIAAVGNSDIVLCHVLLQFVQGAGMPDARGRNFVSAVSFKAMDIFDTKSALL